MKTVIDYFRGVLSRPAPPPLPPLETTSPFVKDEIYKDLERLERRLEALRLIKERV